MDILLSGHYENLKMLIHLVIFFLCDVCFIYNTAAAFYRWEPKLLIGSGVYMLICVWEFSRVMSHHG